MIVVCAGAKSILDLPATWERLETLGVPVVGYRTDELPGFFTAETGIALDSRADDVAEIVAMWRAHRALGPVAVDARRPAAAGGARDPERPTSKRRSQRLRVTRGARGFAGRE